MTLKGWLDDTLRPCRGQGSVNAEEPAAVSSGSSSFRDDSAQELAGSRVCELSHGKAFPDEPVTASEASKPSCFPLSDKADEGRTGCNLLVSAPQNESRCSCLSEVVDIMAAPKCGPQSVEVAVAKTKVKRPAGTMVTSRADVFDSAKVVDTVEEPLTTLAIEMLAGAARELNLNQEKLRCFARKVEAGMLPCDYHSVQHVIDVMQLLYLQTTSGGPIEDICRDPVVKLSALIAALFHDFAHPGYSNGFLIKTESTLRVFKYVEAIILSTDMSKHMDFVQAAAPTHPEELMIFKLQFAMKCADLSHCARKFSSHYVFVEKLKAEFYRQGDKERELKLPVSAGMDRAEDICQIAWSQEYFLSNFILPMYNAWSKHSAFNEMIGKLTLVVQRNISSWGMLYAQPDTSDYEISTTSSIPVRKIVKDGHAAFIDPRDWIDYLPRAYAESMPHVGLTNPELWNPRNDEWDRYLTDEKKHATRDEYRHLLTPDDRRLSASPPVRRRTPGPGPVGRRTLGCTV
eukprot:jgi/Tetstr1/441176/TSEL_029434.t1